MLICVLVRSFDHMNLFNSLTDTHSFISKYTPFHLLQICLLIGQKTNILKIIIIIDKCIFCF